MTNSEFEKVLFDRVMNETISGLQQIEAYLKSDKFTDLVLSSVKKLDITLTAESYLFELPEYKAAVYQLSQSLTIFPIRKEKQLDYIECLIGVVSVYINRGGFSNAA